MREQKNVGASWAGRPCYYYEEVDSTNEEVKRLWAEGAGHGTLVWAQSQSAGKGRRGRAWISPPGSSIFMSLLLKPDFAVEKASMVTLVTALAVRNGIRRVCGISAGIKWPNDIVADGKKLCGILTELELAGNGIGCLVIGIGINVFQQEFPQELRDRATSIKESGGDVPSREALICAVMEAFEDYYEIFVQDGNLKRLQSLYNLCLVNRDRDVMVLDPKGGFAGTALGIEENGALLVKTRDGLIKAVDSGEVSVRGLYGYV